MSKKLICIPAQKILFLVVTFGILPLALQAQTPEEPTKTIEEIQADLAKQQDELQKSLAEEQKKIEESQKTLQVQQSNLPTIQVSDISANVENSANETLAKNEQDKAQARTDRKLMRALVMAGMALLVLVPVGIKKMKAKQK